MKFYMFKRGPTHTKMCTRKSGRPKARYASRELAEDRIAPTLEADYKRSSTRQLMAYECRDCDGWHLGNGYRLPRDNRNKILPFDERLRLEIGDRALMNLHSQNRKGRAKVIKQLLERAAKAQPDKL